MDYSNWRVAEVHGRKVLRFTSTVLPDNDDEIEPGTYEWAIGLADLPARFHGTEPSEGKYWCWLDVDDSGEVSEHGVELAVIGDSPPIPSDLLPWVWEQSKLAADELHHDEIKHLYEIGWVEYAPRFNEYRPPLGMADRRWT